MTGRPIAFAVALYAAVTSMELLRAWRDAPSERGAWVVLLLWLAPLVARRGGAPPRTTWLVAAIALACAGQVAGLNALSYLGLAAALLSWRTAGAIHAAAAALWMPTAGWLLTRLGLPLPVALGLRCALSGLIAARALRGEMR